MSTGFNPGLVTPERTPPGLGLGDKGYDPSAIAICGIGLRLPSGIRNTRDYWDLLVNGRDARGPIPASRYNINGFDDSLGGKGGIKARSGYFLDEDLSALDTSFFSMTRKEVEGCDPQQRHLLEVVKESLDDAGEVNYRGQSVGCYVGTFGDDWLLIGAKETQHQDGYGYLATGNGDMMLANRVSYEYDFKGPSTVVKTGCSASLVGLHEACRAIQAGDATSAIVAGTSIIMTPSISASFTSEGILSPDGSCKTFDEKANGFARAEAITSVYVKPLGAALRDGNPIRAVIRGTGTNSDGRSKGLLSPNDKAQEALMRKVYFDNGLDPGDTAYVECHGTGTATGDPIEANAVGNVFGNRGVYIGSVKPNVGHSEGSSGLNSLIKCVLALENKIIPPNIKFETPNPKIQFAEKNLRVPIAPTPFPTDRLARISINSFGIGGTNAHVVIDAFGERDPISPISQVPRPELLLLSANTSGSLTTSIDRYRDFFQGNPSLSPSNVAYTLAFHRDKLPHRAFALVQGGELIEASAPAKAPGAAPDVFLIFSGQGAQWAGMGSDLIQADELFRRDIESMDAVLQRVEHPPAWSLIQELQKPEADSKINLAEMSQPLCTALQIALINRLTHTGIKPAAIVGHSSGEIAGAYASGAISKEAAIIAAYYRGYVTTKQTLDGSMAAVGLGSEEVSPFLIEGVVVACENSPSSTTISGDKEKVLEVVDKIKAALPDVLARPLKVNMAYHSHHMVGLGEEYVELLRREFEKLGAWSGTPSTTFISSVTGEVIDSGLAFGPEYWLSNLVSPVKFSTAVSALLDTKGDGLFLEIGPHSTLAGPLRQIAAGKSRSNPYVSSQVRGENSVKSLMTALGKLYQESVNVDLGSLYPSAKTLSDLPTYPWDHSQSLWYESRVAQDWRFRKYPHHPLLGVRIPETPDVEPQWRNVLHMEDIAWIADHKVRQDVVFPMAGYIATAGEAARQMTGVKEGYSVQHVVAHAALVLNDTKGTEVITALRKQKLTDNETSELFNFTISSYSGSNWVTHCEGQVQALPSVPAATEEHRLLPRRVSAGRFYDYLAEVGINFGPHFKRLDNASSAVDEIRATADVSGMNEEQNIPYLLHPAVIDSCFQLSILAGAQGLGRNLTQLRVPTLIDRMDIFPGGQNMTATASSRGENGTETVECTADGKTVLKLFGFHTTPIDDGLDPEFDTYAAARLEWLPDFDFVDPAPLFKPANVDRAELHLIEELTLLCMLDTSERIEGLEPCQPHFKKFREWLKIEINASAEGQNRLVADSPTYMSLSKEDRHVRIGELYEKLMTMEKIGLTQGLRRILDNCEGIFTGTTETIDILMQDGVLADLYNVVSFGYSDFVRLLSSTKPTLRILEVGAGTGGTTELILRDLVHEGGLPRYSTYTFTDISAGFFPQAKERFDYAANMEYKVFDISKDPIEQDFQESSYDLIIAANVVHATPSLKGSLSNLNKLLKPQGILVLTEVCTELRSPTYIFGNFDGWWMGENDGREYLPYVPVSRWDEELKASGFTGVDTDVYDEVAPYTCCTTIMSRRVSEVPAPSDAISLISSTPETGVAKTIKDALQAQGLNVTDVKMSEDIPAEGDIVCCVDLEGNFFEDISEADFAAFQNLIQGLKTQKTLWLTKPTQINCVDPRAAGTIGVARTLRSEREVPFHTLEISPDEPDFSALVLKVFGKIRREEDDDNLATDKEFAVCDGVISISRYHPFSLKSEISERSLEGAETITALEIGKPGLIESLYWEERAVEGDLAENSVEIECRAVGLNFRDVLISMGIVPKSTEHAELGIEVAGVIRRVGSQVEGLRVGDRVFAITPNGSLMSRTTVVAALVKRIPDSLSFEKAATIPVVFATALQGLLNMGRLEKGQTVLIHSACGGVGMAAIQIAKMVGAEIYASVGSEEKIRYLTEKFGIPRDHIFNSRDDSFYDGVMRATGHRGVDLVLNSLSGSLLHASWKCVAPFGMMVEIGKRDLLGHGKLDLNPFLANRTYYCFDGMEVAWQRPEMMGRLLEKFLTLYEVGLLQPLPEVKYFPAPESEAAFRFLQGGSHIGKVVVTLPGPDSQQPIQSIPAARHTRFDPQASYILTGGLGGLGRATATWLVERGARSLTFLSRSAASGDNAVFVAELEAMGCEVVVVSGSADKLEDVERAVKECPRPIKGVFHMAMVLEDAPLIEMTFSQWHAAVKPKVDGAWNLHTALLPHTLDFFFLASSVVTTTHQPGQGNYGAGNTFLEALCQYRLGLGLPASVLGICPIRGVGFVADSPAAQRNMRAQGIYDLGEQAFLEYLGHSLLLNGTRTASAGPAAAPPRAWKNEAQVVMGLHSEKDLEDADNPTNWRRDRRMGSYHNVHRSSGAVTSSDSSGLKSFLASAAEDPDILDSEAGVEFLAGEIGRKVYSIMLREGDIDTGISLAALGVDSLMATELRRWFRQVFGLKVGVLEVLGAGSLLQLGRVVGEGIKGKTEP
ncbi:related to polyketide synthase [Cephalotrichum gorgonifer]|uniref:Related to polyketide synthase n=1 Tax=Cephalotrichum gorgonifer TaxID=2041049 RepID=A0AAE8SRR2_9PEZI|nr:related to polyketide synthase [Cephalotrichum gorgonifer]